MARIDDGSSDWFADNAPPDAGAGGDGSSSGATSAVPPPAPPTSAPPPTEAPPVTSQQKPPEDTGGGQSPPTSGPTPTPTTSGPGSGGPGDPKYDANPRDFMINRDQASWEAYLKQQLGPLYNPSVLQSSIANISYAQNAGMDPKTILDGIIAKEKLRLTDTPGSTYVAGKAPWSGGTLTGPAAPKTTGGPGGGGPSQVGPGSSGNSYGYYSAPAVTSSPFINPDGSVPAGMPMSPGGAGVSSPFSQVNDAILQAIRTPALSPDYVNRENESQKELILAREQAARGGAEQAMASRGVLNPGQLNTLTRRLGDQTTSQLTQSQRDIANTAETTNRQGLLDSVSLGNTVFGGEQTRALDANKFTELIRQYNNDLANRQSEFGAGLTYNYDSLNANLENAYRLALLNSIGSGGA